jgi:hypothetical protein
MRVNVDSERNELEVFCHVDNVSTYVRDPAASPGITLTFNDASGRVLTYLSFEQCVKLRDDLTRSIPSAWFK